MAICARCRAANSKDARFCHACGAPLARPVAEERKVVTVVFVDLVGFTSRAERLDPEHVRRLLVPYHASARAELERFGGTVEKFIGDAVMAVFGAPAVHEDDPERAVRAALAIRDAVVEERALQVRIGVTTGETLVAVGARAETGEAMVAGDVVNTAARLQAGAAVNGVLVDEATFRATEGSIRYREHEPVAARGKSTKVRVWEALEPRAQLGLDPRRAARAPLIGREGDLAQLVGALARARSRREPELVTIVGVPGIGKSRMVLELAKRIDAEPDLVTWRLGRSLPYGDGVSFWALSEMVKAEAGIVETDPPEEAEAKLATALASLPLDDLDWVQRHLRPLVGLAPGDGHGSEGGRSEAFAAWRRFFEALAEQRPTVLVFEDLHWADEGLLEFVDHLIDWAVGVPLLVLATARPELYSRRPDWGAGRANASTLALSPLSESESADLVAALSGGGALPPDLLRILLDNAGGNPLYAEEFVRLASDQPLVGGAPVPATVQGIIAARLDTLAPEEKSLLQDAAVLGRVFWTGGVAGVAASERWSVEDVMRRLERREFVTRRRRSAVPGETEYAFGHVLVRDVAYAQIPHAQRAGKHRRAAEWIESVLADRIEQNVEMLAYHYRSALEFATAARQETDELTERLRRALRDAGDRAAALHSWPAAARFYAEALTVWPADRERARLLLEHGRALFRAEDRGEEELEAALTALLEQGDLSLAAEAELLLGGLRFRHGGRDEALARFHRALALVEDTPLSPSKARVFSTLSAFHMVELEAEEAIRYGREALRMAQELGLAEVEASALNNVGFSRATLGDAGGVQDLERSVEIAAVANSPEVIRAYLNLGTSLADLGDLRRMVEVQSEASKAAERFGDAAARHMVAAERLWADYWRGAWDPAAALAEELLAAMEAGAPRLYFEPSARLVRAWLALARGPLEQALDDLAILVEFVREANFVQALFPALALRAHVLAAVDRPDDAWQQADELLRVWRESGVNGCSYWTADLAFAVSRLGRNDDLLQPLLAAPRTRWTEAAQALADREPARAAGMYAEIGSLPDEAHARLLAADRLLARDRSDEARAELDAALAFYRRVGAARYVAEAEGLLAIAV
ncbi:MAG: AAA family ATPase [Thermoleophilia bacterium]|nr:AAA family ATPase [Thermoleophilia bacterium]